MFAKHLGDEKRRHRVALCILEGCGPPLCAGAHLCQTLGAKALKSQTMKRRNVSRAQREQGCILQRQQQHSSSQSTVGSIAPGETGGVGSSSIPPRPLGTS